MNYRIIVIVALVVALINLMAGVGGLSWGPPDSRGMFFGNLFQAACWIGAAIIMNFCTKKKD